MEYQFFFPTDLIGRDQRWITNPQLEKAGDCCFTCEEANSIRCYFHSRCCNWLVPNAELYLKYSTVQSRLTCTVILRLVLKRLAVLAYFDLHDLYWILSPQLSGTHFENNMNYGFNPPPMKKELPQVHDIEGVFDSVVYLGKYGIRIYDFCCCT